MMVTGATTAWRGFRLTTAAIQGVILDEGDHLVLISAAGNYRIDKAYVPEFVFILQTEKEQEDGHRRGLCQTLDWKTLPPW